ncbi:MAG: hypothetical protein EHM35_12605, partial [Planctomycetaceae bacterium]
MSNRFAGHGQRGVALIIVLVILIVVSLGILAMSNGVVNMRRSSIVFGHANEAYNAASAGLNAARGYVKGVGVDGALVGSFEGTLGGSTYTVTLSAEIPTGYPLEEPYKDN